MVSLRTRGPRQEVKKTLFLAIALINLTLCGCSFNFPAYLLPPPLPVEREDGQVKSTLFPLPVVATDPNTGTDVGILPVWIFPRDDKAIGMILAPSVIDNTEAGTSLTMRLLAYPSKDVTYRFIADPSTKTRSYFEFAYEKSATQAGDWFYSGLMYYDCDIFPRFYGFGNDSRDSNQTSYTSRERHIQGSVGYRIADFIEIAWYERYNFTSLSENHLPDLPSTGSLFPGVMQDTRNTAFIHGLSVSYDTRDFKESPTCGMLARIAAETSLTFLGADSSFDKIYFDLRGFQPWDPDDRRIVTAVRLAGEFMTRETNTPFYRWPTLGGYTTDRGWGEWRWIDRNMITFTVEQRFDVYQFSRFGVVTHFEVAPFVDVGKVFPTFGKFNFRNLHPAGGIAFRAVVRPQVVGHVEVGVGRGGNTSVFMGLGYPF